MGLAREEMSALCALINEFYETTDAIRRTQLNDKLCSLHTEFDVEKTISICLQLSASHNARNVQYFGALCLYDTVRQRWEQCIQDPHLAERIKAYLIGTLTENSFGQMHSLTHKQSATLAIFALYSMPDIWPAPINDLTALWSNQPQLLLSVVREVAAQFPNVMMPLTQRSALKTELLRVSQDVISLVSTVLAACPTSECLNATVECVEAWLRLPGVGLDQWSNLLKVIFTAVQNDSAALTNILTVLAASDELNHMDTLLKDIFHFMAAVVRDKVVRDLRDDSKDSEETIALVAAAANLLEKTVTRLIYYAFVMDGKPVLRDVCSWLCEMACWPGVFAVDEAVSDLPARFFTTLREDIAAISFDKGGDKIEEVKQTVKEFYARMLEAAVEKVAYPKASVFTEMDREQKEQFRRYREDRSELAVDCYQLVGSETVDFLNAALTRALEEADRRRVESALYLWECVADYLSMELYPQIVALLDLCQKLSDLGSGREGDQLGRTLMRLLFNLSHLITEHDRACELEAGVFRLIVPCLSRQSVCEEALRTLDKFASGRPKSLSEFGEELTSCCYEFFADETHPEKRRLEALRVIGYVLSKRPPDVVMEVLGRVLAPYVGDIESSSVSEERRLFQISIFASLFATLQTRNAAERTDAPSPLVIILQQAGPVFKAIVNNKLLGTAVADKVLDAMRSALTTLRHEQVPQFVPLYCEVLDSTLDTSSTSACNLTKSLVLSIGPGIPETNALVRWLSDWAVRFDEAQPSINTEEWAGMLYQIIRKEWRSLRHPDVSAEGLQLLASAGSMATKAMSSSEEPLVVRGCAQILASITSQTVQHADKDAERLLASQGEHVIRVVFSRVQVELTRQTVDCLAEVLFFYVKHFPSETRNVLSSLPHGDSPLVAALFRDVGNLRNFKQMTNRLNLAARKDAKNV